MHHDFKGILSPFSFVNHPGFIMKESLEGYLNFSFGGRAGPEISIEHVLHEIAHAIEFGPDEFENRVSRFGFHFIVPKVEIRGKMYNDPRSNLGTIRELRTMAIQWQFHRALGIDTNADDYCDRITKSLRFMPDWGFVPGDSDEDRHNWRVEYLKSNLDFMGIDECLERFDGWLNKTVLALSA